MFIADKLGNCLLKLLPLSYAGIIRFRYQGRHEALSVFNDSPSGYRSKVNLSISDFTLYCVSWQGSISGSELPYAPQTVFKASCSVAQILKMVCTLTSSNSILTCF